MRSKAILSIVAFSAAFGISVTLTPQSIKSSPSYVPAPYVKRCSANREAAYKITTLLRQDIANGIARDRNLNVSGADDLLPNSKSFVGYADAIDNYASVSAAIDDTDLPADFKAAWQLHMKAWRDHADYLNDASASSRKVPNNSFATRYSEQNAEISETWYEVLRVARNYDAYIPPNAY